MRRVYIIALAALMLQACGTSVKEASINDLPVRKQCTLERLYKDMM